MNSLVNRRRVLGSKDKSILPAEYSALEYVSSNVTSDNPTCPGFTLAVPFSVRLEVEPVILSTATQYNCLFGANGNLQLAYHASGKPTNGNAQSTSYYYEVGKKAIVEGGFASNATIDNSMQYYKIDGVDMGLGRKTTSTIFALNGACTTSLKNVTYLAKVKYYSVKVFKDGACIIDLYPCKRKADSVNGLYDIVNDVFYATNWLDS